ncbi:bacteriophage T4 gp5 trimerisation domain-containing protein, partial [Xenorhabdus anantnagensis]|nr:type VI secretion system tip protein VgrG [Xenorhabdus anantnagensis]
DAKGSEKLALHAQKDMSTEVLNDRSTRVVHDHTESVGNNQVITVRKDRHKEIIGTEVSSIGTRQVTVEKTSVLSAKGAITIQSTEAGIHIGNTKGSISIDKEGNIHITGDTVIINGQKVITLN